MTKNKTANSKNREDVVDSTRPREMIAGAPETPKAKPTIGFLILLVSLTIYAFLAAALGDVIVEWPIWSQSIYYIAAGVAWIWPAGRILRWALT